MKHVPGLRKNAQPSTAHQAPAAQIHLEPTQPACMTLRGFSFSVFIPSMYSSNTEDPLTAFSGWGLDVENALVSCQ